MNSPPKPENSISNNGNYKRAKKKKVLLPLLRYFIVSYDEEHDI